MNLYEDKYLRERVSRIIARQREGKIVIAAYKDGSGLPTREDLSQPILRASYPYDYAVGNAGFLNYSSDLGAYLYTPQPGTKQPEVITHYQTLRLAEAELDVPRRRVRIQVDDTSVSFTGVQPWKGLHEVLRELNDELARVNTGIVVWKIIPKEDKKVALENRLFPAAVPRLRNGQALAHVTGYAYDDNQTLAYIGLVGYKTSLESLKVTLMAGKPVHLSQDGVADATLIPTDRYEQAWQAMPEHTSHHVAFISRLAVPGKWEPDDPAAYLLVFRETPDPGNELIHLFIERLKEDLEIPILNSWARVLWSQAQNRKYVRNLKTGGDCIAGAKIDLQADWQALFAELLAQEALPLTA